MTGTDRVMALLTEANPIPDVEILGRRTRFTSADFTTEVLPDPVEPSRPRRLRWTLVAAIVAAALLLVFALGTRPTVDPVDTVPAPTPSAAPQPTEPPAPEPTPTAEPTALPDVPQTIEGAWDARSFGLVFDDGTYAVTAFDLTVDRGTYVYEGNELTLVSDEASASCAEGAQARFAVDFIEGALELDPIVDDDCGFDRGLGVGAKSLATGQATGIPPSVLDVPRPLHQISGPGLYIAERFSPGFSIELPPGWSYHASALAPDIDYSTSINDNQVLIAWHLHDVDVPEGVYDLFTDHPNVVATEPRMASIAGVEGLTFDFPSPGPNNLLFVPGPGAGSIIGPPDNIWRTWAVEVDDVVVTIVALFSPETMSETAVEVDQILNSIIWDPE